MKGTKALVTMLERKGVDTIFGYPGGSVIPIYDEIYDANLRHILVRHEQCAAHMADGYARASGRPGVCIATSGPGATNLVTGVATAYADSVPMIALTGQVGVGSLGLGAFQEVDAYSLLMPITKHNFRVLDVNRLPHAIKEAWEICQTGRPGPVHVDLPVDQMNASIDPALLDEEYGIKPIVEDLSGLDEAVQWIRDAKRPVILCGGGAVNASDEVMALSRRLGAPVDTTLMGMGIVPSSYELCMGPLGMHGRMSALEMMNDADLIISVGSRFSDRTYGKRCRMQNPNGRVVHIDIDPVEFGKHKHPCVNLLSDCGRALRMILERLGSSSVADDWTQRARDAKVRCCCDQGREGQVLLRPRHRRDADQAPDRDARAELHHRRGHHRHHRRRAEPDVGYALPRHRAPPPAALLRDLRDHGVRPPRRHRRQGRQARQARHRHTASPPPSAPRPPSPTSTSSP